MRASILTFLPLALASPVTHLPRGEKSIFWLLAGDSTTATPWGWGDGFLATTVKNGSSGKNYGHDGATTASFRSMGDWANVIKDVELYKDEYEVYVTIQFGHNDQKPVNNVSLADYRTNLARFAAEAKAAGATPIHLTSMTRRNFVNETGKVIPTLANERNITVEVATENNSLWIDMNIVSEDYVNAIGIEAASKYNFEPTDWTHLSPWGSVVFGRMVSDLLVEKYPERFERFTVKNDTMSALLKAQKPV